ncbi:cold shock domain-containing protein [Candidatus Woesearchaeota archaeon]|nr:cold shock domain-containing protein [Candidatus Woesearchaeota archaeon]
MVEGTVKFFNAAKHFGFITADDGNEYFVHQSGIAPGVTVVQGDKVKFNVVDGDRGKKAEGVEKV